MGAVNTTLGEENSEPVSVTRPERARAYRRPRRTPITWVRGGIEEPGRPEKIMLTLPPEIRIEGRTG